VTITADRAHVRKAPVFIAWWQKLIELDERLTEILTDDEWRRPGGEIRTLLIAMDDIGRAAGATRIYAQDTSEGSTEIGATLNPDYDWVDGEIDFGPVTGDWHNPGPRGEDLIRRIERVTGILAESVQASVVPDIVPDVESPEPIGFHYLDPKSRKRRPRG
jgi:hypothetical protein